MSSSSAQWCHNGIYECLGLMEGTVLSVPQGLNSQISDVQQFRQGDYTMGRQQRFYINSFQTKLMLYVAEETVGASGGSDLEGPEEKKQKIEEKVDRLGLNVLIKMY